MKKNCVIPWLAVHNIWQEQKLALQFPYELTSILSFVLYDALLKIIFHSASRYY